MLWVSGVQQSDVIIFIDYTPFKSSYRILALFPVLYMTSVCIIYFILY